MSSLPGKHATESQALLHVKQRCCTNVPLYCLPLDAKRSIVIVSCPSVCHVTLVIRKYPDNQIRVSTFRSRNIGDLVQGKHPQNSDGIVVRSLFSARTCNISLGLTGQDRTKAILLMTNRKLHTRIRAFDWFQNQRPWMTLNSHYALCFKMHASFRAHHENLNDKPILPQQRRSPMTRF